MKKLKPYWQRGAALLLAVAVLMLLVLSGQGLSRSQPDQLPQTSAQPVRLEGQGGTSHESKDDLINEPDTPDTPVH